MAVEVTIAGVGLGMEDELKVGNGARSLHGDSFPGYNARPGDPDGAGRPALNVGYRCDRDAEVGDGIGRAGAGNAAALEIVRRRLSHPGRLFFIDAASGRVLS